MRIFHYFEKELKEKCMPVTSFDNELRVLANNMINHVRVVEALGLAANQVGQNKRLFIARVNNGDIKPFVNPEILEATGKTKLFEACLSVPGKSLKIKRKSFVRLKYFDLNGNEKTDIFAGMDAVCIQHEIDHLDGITIIDKYQEQTGNIIS